MTTKGNKSNNLPTGKTAVGSSKRKPARKTGKTHSKVKSTPAQKNAILEARKTRKATTPKKPVTRRDRPGRPSIITKELIAKVEALIMAGAYIETACAAVGFSKSLYHEWLKLGRNRSLLVEQAKTTDDPHELQEIVKKIEMIDPIYQQFSDAIQKAALDAEHRDIVRIDEAAAKNWTAAAWKLERKYPERWARKTKVEHEGQIDNPSAGGPTIDQTRAAILTLMRDPKTLDLAEQLIDRIAELEDEQ